MHIEKPPLRTENESIIYDLIDGWADGFIPRISDVFIRSGKALEKIGKDLKIELLVEDYETQVSMATDFSLGSQLNPDTGVLRLAHFITLHSEFEQLWKELFTVVHEVANLGIPKKTYPIAHGCIPSEVNVITAVINKWVILLDYNFLRNKMVHGKTPPSAIFESIKNKVELNEIKGLVIKEIRADQENPESKANAYYILQQEFVDLYEIYTTNFLYELASAICPNR